MTERLSQLLHSEADDLDVPPPDPGAALARGQRLRRRRTAGVAGAAAGALLLVSAAAVAIAGSDDDRTVEPADPPSVTENVPAFGSGSKVYLGDKVATVPDTVHSLHYTSAGVLVRSNPNDGASDGSGPESLTLAKYDGSTVDLGTIPEGVGPATDPDESVYALAEASGDGFVAVVRDAETGETVDEVPLPGLPPSYWEVPPLALDGDTLYVGYESETAAVDLATGDHRIVEGMQGGGPRVAGGRTVISANKSLSVVDTTTGDELLSVDTGEYPFGSLSPDGRYVNVSDSDGTSTMYDVATGKTVDLEQLRGVEPGWTSDGDAFVVKDGTVTTCDLDARDCTEADVPVKGGGDLRLGGQRYES